MIGVFEAMRSAGDWETQLYPLSAIVLVDAVPPRERLAGDWWFVERQSDESVYLSERLWQDLQRRPLQLLTAERDLHVVRGGYDEDGFWNYREPVIAWASCFDGQIRPVTRAGVDSGLPFWDAIYVQYPDGRLRGASEVCDLDNMDALRELTRHNWTASKSATVGPST